jgi:hypothetical protein
VNGVAGLFQNAVINSTLTFFAPSDTQNTIDEWTLSQTAFSEFSIPSGGAASTPEASTWAMMLMGFVGLAFAGYRKVRKPISIMD